MYLQKSKHQKPKTKFVAEHNVIHNKRNTQSGITLVALIITIIVLLILAMVSIRLVMNGGIIDKAENTAKTYSDEEIGEQLKLAYAEYQMSQYTGTPVNIQAKLQEIYGQDTTAELKNGKLKATINGKVYQYDVNSGKSGEYQAINYGSKTKATIQPGDDITIGGTEKFKVFSVTNEEIKAMPYYNLKLDSDPMRQATEAEAEAGQEGKVAFCNTSDGYWSTSDIEIDMNNPANNLQKYINKYKDNLIKITEQQIDVRAGSRNNELENVEMLMRNPGQKGEFCLGSVHPWGVNLIFYVHDNGDYEGGNTNTERGVRPIIIIQK